MSTKLPTTVPITLIIGAGANKEIHPEIGLGIELLQQISERVTDKASPHNPYLSNALNKYLPHLDFETRFHFLKHLERYMISAETPSIDSFIYEIQNYPEYEKSREKYIEIARVMIISHVLGWEGTDVETRIKEERHNQETWLSVLSAYIDRYTLLKDKAHLKIVTFNYDRILEKYLWFRYGRDCYDFIDNNITHVYGRIGDIDQLGKRKLSDGSPERHLKFGHDNNDFKTIAEVRDHISLIHDKINEEKLHQLVTDNDRKKIIFGYGLDYINNKRLGLDKAGILHREENLAFNVYHGRVVDFDFSIRRKTVEKVRTIARKACIKFLPSREFLNWGLNEFIPEGF